MINVKPSDIMGTLGRNAADLGGAFGSCACSSSESRHGRVASSSELESAKSFVTSACWVRENWATKTFYENFLSWSWALCCAHFEHITLFIIYRNVPWLTRIEAKERTGGYREIRHGIVEQDLKGQQIIRRFSARLLVREVCLTLSESGRPW